eukprot:3180368-Karenia_brevis.AAC.1
MVISFSAAISAIKRRRNITIVTVSHACQIFHAADRYSHASPVLFDVLAVVINCKGLLSMVNSFNAAISAYKGCRNIAFATTGHACQILFDVDVLE